MDSAAVERFLRLLRRRLDRQLRLLREERLPEALDLEPQLQAMFDELQQLDLASAERSPLQATLRRQCAELTDRIQPYFQQEHRLLSREWVALQVDSELRRLAQEPGPDETRSGRQSSISD